MKVIDMAVIVAAENGDLPSVIRANIRKYGLFAAAQWACKRNIRVEYFINCMKG